MENGGVKCLSYVYGLHQGEYIWPISMKYCENCIFMESIVIDFKTLQSNPLAIIHITANRCWYNFVSGWLMDGFLFVDGLRVIGRYVFPFHWTYCFLLRNSIFDNEKSGKNFQESWDQVMWKPNEIWHLCYRRFSNYVAWMINSSVFDKHQIKTIYIIWLNSGNGNNYPTFS